MKDKKKIYILFGIALLAITLFLVYGLNINNYEYNLSKRIPRVIAIIITGGSIAFSSIIFQTITNNRIITPSVLGLDSLYGFLQSFVVFIFGISSIVMTDGRVNFLVSSFLMILGSMILYKFLLGNGKSNIYFLLFVGTIFGTLFKSLSTFMQVLIDPNDYVVLQSKLFASFTNVNTSILLLVIIILLIIVAFIYDDMKKIDVLHLGRDNSISLGVDYDRISKKFLIVVSILISISTALVGSITFLGILVVNLSYQLIKSYKHKYLIASSILISIIALVGGQFIVERLLNYNTKISIIINFIGGAYFIYLLLKENK
ncbi:MAG: iron chelate uptake ABC transporter family permease subunit [Clostridium sp.]|nr:iron chelate uptake ABC transporter family permease subunit [Clostridium sp.]MCI7441559.1 iron chelate uptake ABC transporter family permease subunit [Clostridium sp.]